MKCGPTNAFKGKNGKKDSSIFVSIRAFCCATGTGWARRVSEEDLRGEAIPLFRRYSGKYTMQENYQELQNFYY